MDLGNKVKARRIELNMSQEDLARKMGYSSRTSINKIENGRPCSQKIIMRLAEALDVGVAYLMGWDGDIKKDPEGLAEKHVDFIVEYENYKIIIEHLNKMDDRKLKMAEKIIRSLAEADD